MLGSAKESLVKLHGIMLAPFATEDLEESEDAVMQFLPKKRHFMLKVPEKGQTWRDQRNIPKNRATAPLLREQALTSAGPQPSKGS